MGENLYSVAKHIEALRGQERWGVGSVEQAFAGYAALPAPGSDAKNYTAVARNPTMQHIFRMVALAPDFLEARLRFTDQAAKGLLGKVGREQLVAMATLFATQFVMTRLFNKLFDNDYHFERPFSAVHGGRSYTLRSVPEDIYKAVTNTAQFLSARESPALNTGVQLLTGRNYRGERTDTADTLREAAAGALPISLRDLPGLKDLSTTQRNSTVTAWEQILGPAVFTWSGSRRRMIPTLWPARSRRARA